jgi:hypothetical protein
MCSVEAAGIGHKKKEKRALLDVFGQALGTLKKNNKSFVVFVQCGGSRKKEEARGTKIN